MLKRDDGGSRDHGRTVAPLLLARAEEQGKEQKGRTRNPRHAVLPAVLTSMVLALMLPSAARGDGARPNQPYHYLHPPRYLQDINSRPRSISRTLSRGTLSQFWFTFTHDGQAGVSATGQPFDLPAKDRGIRVTIAPVETPGELPDTLYVDGNAYSVSVRGIPNNETLHIRRPVTVTMRWPRLPHAIYRYSRGSWTELCSLRQATYTPATIACNTTSLGIIAAVVVGPRRPRSTWQSRLQDTVTHWIWVIIVLIVVPVAAVGIWIVLRRRPGPRPTL